MRRLLLVRHAKSSWEFPELTDHDRPLNARGERDVTLMAQHLADKGENLNGVYSSTAIRAIVYAQTLSEFSGALLTPDSSFYTFDV